jgi:hypothetical protein
VSTENPLLNAGICRVDRATAPVLSEFFRTPPRTPSPAMTSNIPSPSEFPVASDVTYHNLFDDCDADIILQSKDGILFRVPSTVLQKTSTFFRSMLSLPQGSQSPRLANLTLPLDEEAWIVEPVLRMVCGLPIIIDEVLDSFDTVEPILHCCDKYGMGGPLSIIQSAITRPRLLENPLRLYKLACRYDWPEAKLAGWLCLKYDISHPDTIMRLGGLDLSAYSRLMDLALRRREKFEESLNDPQKFQGSRFVTSD